MHILNIGKRRRILKNHMLLQDTEKSTTLFLHGQFCIMLIEHDKLQDEDEDDDVEADFPEYSMYQE
jgi:HD superfamily phosphohydrolase YqeK